MSALDESTRHYCEQQAQRAGAAFRLARQFLPAERQERAVVLTAFVETIEAVASDVSDPGIAATKFEWWRRALEGRGGAGEHHPLVSALTHHGQFAENRRGRLQAHVGAVGSMVDPAPVGTSDELFEQLSAPGALRSLILSDAETGNAPREALARHGAVSIALRLLSSEMPRPRPTAWWVPMDWRAQFAGIGDDENRRENLSSALVAETATLLLAWQQEADERLTVAGERREGHSHLLGFLSIEAGLRVRWLRRVASDPSAFLQPSGSRLRWRDAWFAWRRARRVLPSQTRER